MREDRFDLVFIDPPYGKNFIPDILSEIFRCKLLTSTSRIVVESLKDDNCPANIGSLHLFDERIYGSTKLSIYICEEK